MTKTETIWFVSDTHFSHKRILNFCEKRIEALNIDINEENVLQKHNDALIKKWNDIVKKHDTVYILGDFSFATTEETMKILQKLHGKKHLIVGNHDASCKGLNNYFVTVSQIRETLFKKSKFTFMDEDMHCVMCHFPLMAWNKRMHGAIMLHGHTHGSLDKINETSEELRVDVGFDSQLNNCNLISLETVYNHMKHNVAKGKTFQEHIEYLTNKTGFRA